MKTKKIIGYHFVDKTLRDGRPIPADGEWLVHDGPVRICISGLHYSPEPYDALKWAPGNTLCLVEIEGVIDTQNDKGVCRRRKIIARIDAGPIQWYFARMQALSVVHLYPNGTDDVVFDYLMTGNEALRNAARDAARDAARAARDAAGAARDAAWAARDAAGYAAWEAAWEAGEAGRAEFNALIYAEFKSMGAL